MLIRPLSPWSAWVRNVSIRATCRVNEKVLQVYRNRHPVAKALKPLVIEMPLIGSRFSAGASEPLSKVERTRRIEEYPRA